MLTQAFRRAPGRLTRGSPSSVVWTWITNGCGGSTHTTAWNPRSMLTRSGCGWAQQAAPDCTLSRPTAKLDDDGPLFSSIVWSAYGRPDQDTLTVLRSLSKSIARKRNVVSAEVVFQRLQSSITLEIWKRCPRQIRSWTLDPDLWPAAGAPPPLRALALVLCALLIALCLWPALVVCSLPLSVATAGSLQSCPAPNSLLQLAAQLASLVSFQDTVAQGIHTLLVTAPKRTEPAPAQSSSRTHARSRSPLPKRAPAQRCPILLGEGGSSTVVAVKCFPLALPGRTRLSRVWAVAAAPAVVPQESAEPAKSAGAPSLPPHGPPISLHPPVAQQACQAQPDAAEAQS